MTTVGSGLWARTSLLWLSEPFESACVNCCQAVSSGVKRREQEDCR
jgi:hypothetical protein